MSIDFDLTDDSRQRDVGRVDVSAVDRLRDLPVTAGRRDQRRRREGRPRRSQERARPRI